MLKQCSLLFIRYVPLAHAPAWAAWVVPAMDEPRQVTAAAHLPLTRCPPASSTDALLLPPLLPSRLRYWALAAGNCGQVVCGACIFHNVFPPAAGTRGSTLLAAFSVISGNGTIYQLAFTKLTPLPLRLLGAGSGLGWVGLT